MINHALTTISGPPYNAIICENPFRTVHATIPATAVATPKSAFNTFFFQFPGNNSLLGLFGFVNGFGKK